MLQCISVKLIFLDVHLFQIYLLKLETLEAFIIVIFKSGSLIWKY